MRRMTLQEQEHLLKTMATNRFHADMMTFDCICYGGALEDYRDARDYVEKSIKAIPEDIRNQYDQALNKEKADKLRREADIIEKGAS